MARKTTVVESIDRLQALDPFPLNLCDSCKLKDTCEYRCDIEVAKIGAWKTRRHTTSALIYKCNKYEAE